MNELIPMNFESLRTDEAVYDCTVTEKLKRYWLTSYGMGQMFGAKNPREFVGHLRNRFPNLPGGTVRTVRTVDGKIREVLTYDLMEVFEYARHSILPGAKQYVARFPYIILDIQSGKIKPLPPRARRKLIALDGLKELECVRYGERVDTRKRIAEGLNMGLSTTYRHEKLSPGHRYTRGWKRHLIEKYLPTWLKIEELLQEGKWQQKEIAQKLGVSPSVVSHYVNIYSKKVGELLAYGA